MEVEHKQMQHIAMLTDLGGQKFGDKLQRGGRAWYKKI